MFTKTVFYYLRKSSFIVGLFLYTLVDGATLSAQYAVSDGLDSIEAIFHIKYEIPKDFKDLNTVQSWKPNKSSPGGTFCYVFESKDKQCRVLYNVFPAYPECTCYTRDKIYRELKSVLDTDDFILNDYLHILSVNEAQARFNADSIFFYNVPTVAFNMGAEIFTHCTRMFITKPNKPVLDFVWYFTDEGKKKEKKYLQKISKRIWYNDSDWDVDDQRWEAWMKKHFEELTNKN